MGTNTSTKKTFTLKAINPIILLCIMIVCATILTYFLPAGVFDTIKNAATGREIVNPTTYHYVPKSPVGWFDMFMAIPRGMVEQGDIIFFIFIIGGAFQVIRASGAFTVGMSNVVRKMKGHEYLLAPVCMTLFTLISAFAACSEEFLAFVPLMIAVSIASGFDSITGVAICYLAVGAGYGAGVTNAFTVGIAQGISGLPLFSGIGIRFGLLFALTGVSAAYLTWYAKRIKKNPSLSCMHEIDKSYNVDIITEGEIPRLTGRQKLVILIFIGSIVALIVGVLKFGFYITELSALYLIVGVLAGIVAKMPGDRIVNEFMIGAKDLFFAAICTGFSKAIALVLTDANVIDTIINFLASMLHGLTPTVTAIGMFVVQDIINIVVPSGSGQAALTMPIMAPLSDLVGITRQTAVLAFQLGDSFTNIVSPTCGMIVAAVAMGKIPFGKWLKFMFPVFCMWYVVAFAALAFAVKTGYGPF